MTLVPTRLCATDVASLTFVSASGGESEDSPAPVLPPSSPPRRDKPRRASSAVVAEFAEFAEFAVAGRVIPSFFFSSLSLMISRPSGRNLPVFSAHIRSKTRFASAVFPRSADHVGDSSR